MTDNTEPKNLASFLDNTNDIDDSFPLLKPGVYLFTITKIELVKSKKFPDEQLTISPQNEIGNQIRIGLALAEPGLDTDNQPIRPGMPLSKTISLIATDTYTQKDIGRFCVQFKKAVTGSKEGSMWPLAQFVGKNVPAQVVIQDAKGEYGIQNSIKAWIVPKD